MRGSVKGPTGVAAVGVAVPTGTEGSVGAAGVSVGTVGVSVGVAVGVLVGVLVGVGVSVMPANGAASLTLPLELINPNTNRIAIKRQPVKIDLAILFTSRSTMYTIPRTPALFHHYYRQKLRKGQIPNLSIHINARPLTLPQYDLFVQKSVIATRNAPTRQEDSLDRPGKIHTLQNRGRSGACATSTSLTTQFPKPLSRKRINTLATWAALWRGQSKLSPHFGWGLDPPVSSRHSSSPIGRIDCQHGA